jgi:hypothetical protein
MEVFQKSVTNPLSIAFAVVHWFVVAFAIYGEQHTQPFHSIYEPLLTQILFFINILPIIAASLVSSPFRFLSEQNSLLWAMTMLIYFAFITFQWLLIGAIFTTLIERFRIESGNSSLEIK